MFLCFFTWDLLAQNAKSTRVWQVLISDLEGEDYWLLLAVILRCRAIGERKQTENREHFWTVFIMLGTFTGGCLGIRWVRATCCSHVLVSVCGMIVCGHYPVYLCVACVCRQLVVFLTGIFRLLSDFLVSCSSIYLLLWTAREPLTGTVLMFLSCSRPWSCFISRCAYMFQDNK